MNLRNLSWSIKLWTLQRAIKALERVNSLSMKAIHARDRMLARKCIACGSRRLTTWVESLDGKERRRIDCDHCGITWLDPVEANNITEPRWSELGIMRK